MPALSSAHSVEWWVRARSIVDVVGERLLILFGMGVRWPALGSSAAHSLAVCVWSAHFLVLWWLMVCSLCGVVVADGLLTLWCCGGCCGG